MSASDVRRPLHRLMICVGFPYLRARSRRNVKVLLRTPAATAATSRDCGGARSFFCLTAPMRAIVSGRSPMTDIAYLSHKRGGVHDMESYPGEPDSRPARDCQLRTVPAPWQPRSPRRFLRWRMTRGFAQAPWPGISASSTSGLGQWSGAGTARARSDRPVTAGQQLVAAMRAPGRR